MREPLPNSGQVKVQQGELRCVRDGIYSGSFDVSQGATLTFSDLAIALPAVHTFLQGSAITGDGQVFFSCSSDQSQMMINANVWLQMQNFQFDGSGVIAGNGAISAVEFAWVSGTIQNVGVNVRAGDELEVGSEGPCVLDNALLTDQGTVDWDGPTDLVMKGAAKISIDGSQGEGIFNISNAQNIVNGNPQGWGGAPPSIEVVAGGSLVKHDRGVTGIQVAFSSTSGQIELDGGGLTLFFDYSPWYTTIHIGSGGVLQIFGGFSQQGGVTDVDGGTLKAWNLACDGTFYLGGGTLDVGTGNVRIWGGWFDGDGIILGNVISQGGTFNVSGTTTISGNFTQVGNGNLTIMVGGNQAGSYGQLSVQGDVNLDGMVNVGLQDNGYMPTEGVDTFDIVTFAGQRTGTFAGVNPFGSAANFTWTFDYNNPNSVTLRV